jgi:L-amino acid N-acyltransferase YncA
LVVARCAAEIAGFAYAGKHNQRAAYRWTVDVTVYVDGQKRRGGVGAALYRVLLETLKRQGFRSAFAEIVLPNSASVRLHERAGFKSIRVHKDIGHKLGRWHDIGYWRLGLADGAAPPSEPIPFADFKETVSFADVLGELT